MRFLLTTLVEMTAVEDSRFARRAHTMPVAVIPPSTVKTTPIRSITPAIAPFESGEFGSPKHTEQAVNQKIFMEDASFWIYE